MLTNTTHRPGKWDDTVSFRVLIEADRAAGKRARRQRMRRKLLRYGWMLLGLFLVITIFY